jgi:hypothetical protein
LSTKSFYDSNQSEVRSISLNFRRALWNTIDLEVIDAFDAAVAAFEEVPEVEASKTALATGAAYLQIMIESWCSRASMRLSGRRITAKPKMRLSCLSWNWRERSSVKITEGTHEKRKKALHRRRKSSHLETALAG